MMKLGVTIVLALAAGPLLGGMIAGLDRILTARLQARIGPRPWQAYADVTKLLGKEKIVVNVWQAFCAYCCLAAASIALVLFFLKSDLLLILFVQATGALFLVLGALSSTSPFSQIGALRELLQILAYEPLLVLVTGGIYLVTGSFKLTAVFESPSPLIFKLPFLFLALCLSLVIKLRKSPLDLSASHHAHQELVKGVLTDYSGPFLALVEIGHWYEILLLLGFCALFWATSPWGMVLMVILAYGSLILVDTVTARMNWRWMLTWVWTGGLGLAMANLIWLYAARG